MPWDKAGNPDCDPACCGGEGCEGEICAQVIACEGSTPLGGHTIEVREHSLPHDLVASGTTNSSGYACFSVPPGEYDVTRKPPLTGPQYEETRTTEISEDCETDVIYFAVPELMCIKAEKCGAGVDAHWEFTGGYDDQDGALACIYLGEDATFPITATVTVDGVSKSYTFEAPECQVFRPVLDFTPGETCFTVRGCAADPTGSFYLPLDGAFVQLTFDDESIASGITDETGQICIDSPTHAGEVASYVIQAYGYIDSIGSVTVGCSAPEVFMFLDDGFYCCPSCVHPTKNVWSYTDSGGTESPHLDGSIDDTYSACSDVPYDGTKYGGPCLTPFTPRHTARTVDIRCRGFFEGENVWATKKFRVSISWRGIICGRPGPIDPETGNGTTIYEPFLFQNDCDHIGGEGGEAVIGLSLHQDIDYDDPCFNEDVVLSGSWPATVDYYFAPLDMTFTFDCPVAGTWVATET